MQKHNNDRIFGKQIGREMISYSNLKDEDTFERRGLVTCDTFSFGIMVAHARE